MSLRWSKRVDLDEWCEECGGLRRHRQGCPSVAVPLGDVPVVIELGRGRTWSEEDECPAHPGEPVFECRGCEALGESLDWSW
jgi:hypothetical protein